MPPWCTRWAASPRAGSPWTISRSIRPTTPTCTRACLPPRSPGPAWPRCGRRPPPTQTTYLYYVLSDEEGRHAFTDDFDEFLRLAAGSSGGRADPVRLVLLGDPVAHSRSPAIQRAALAAAGILGSYEARRVDAAGVYRACAEIRAGSLRGANVTMPHKRRGRRRRRPPRPAGGALPGGEHPGGRAGRGGGPQHRRGRPAGGLGTGRDATGGAGAGAGRGRGGGSRSGGPGRGEAGRRHAAARGGARRWRRLCGSRRRGSPGESRWPGPWW